MSTATDTGARTAKGPGTRATILSEWTKLRSVRSTWVTLAIALAIGLGLSTLFSLATTTTFKTLTPQERANFDAAGTSMVGVNIALILFAVFGALAASAEYSTGMMKLTLTVTPDRRRVLVAKAVLVAALSYVAGAVLALLSFLIGQAVIGASDASLALSLGDPHVVPSLLNWGTENAAFALIALAIAVLTRNAAGAIATTIGIIFAPLIISSILPVWVQEHVLAYLPASAAANLTNPKPDPASPAYLDPQVASAVVALWVVGLLMIAHTVLRERDSG